MASTVATLVVMAFLALVPLLAWSLNEPYFLDLVARFMVFALAAVSLNLITGYGGMVSLGHAMFLGIGAYVVGIMAFHGVSDAFLQLAVTVGLCGLAAAFVGFVAIRSHGIFFIMITLALAQIFYYFALSTGQYGGEEGLIVMTRSEFYELIDMYDPYQFYFLCLGFLVLGLALTWRLVRSPFGLVLISCRENERRAKAIGYNTFAYKLVAMVISGAMCGVAGFLLANLSEYVTPDYGYWFRSGELLVMILLGGMGTLIGPVLGAFALLSLEHWVSGMTRYWGLVIGPILIIVVLATKGGIIGLLELIGTKVLRWR